MFQIGTIFRALFLCIFISGSIRAFGAEAKTYSTNDAHFNPANLKPSINLHFNLKQDGSFTMGAHILVLSEGAFSVRQSGSSYLFNWPKGFFNPSKFLFVDEKGSVIESLPIESVQNGIGKTGKLRTNKSGRFCLVENTENQSIIRMCSDLKQIDGKGSFTSKKETVETKLKVNGKEQNLSGDLSFKEGDVVKVEVQFSSGAYLQIGTRVPALKLYDYFSDNGDLTIVGYGTPPFDRYEKISDSEAGFKEKIGFDATIGDNRKFWKYKLQKGQTGFFIKSDASGIFSCDFDVNAANLPQESTKVKTSEGTLQNYTKTYNAHLQVPLVAAPNYKFMGMNENQKSYLWNIDLPEAGAQYDKAIKYSFKNKDYTAGLSIYRGMNQEISTRLTAIQSSSSSLLLYELLYSRWFESLFGWQNNTFSRLRWGMDLKYTTAQVKFAASSGSSNSGTMQITNADFKYRFSQGLWGRDESVGLLMGYQGFSFAGYQSQLAGAGFFWARSMPRVFDNLFNYLPFMNYPKWVDMEYINYFSNMSTNSDITGTNASLNFHGKVMWSKHIFGEAGFGTKSYSFSNKTTAEKLSFNSFYGTIGLGYNF